MIDLNLKQAKKVLKIIFGAYESNWIRPCKILKYQNIEAIFEIPRFFKVETQTTVKHLFVLCSLDKLKIVIFLSFL